MKLSADGGRGNKKLRTTMVCIGAFLLGAALDYEFLLFVDGLKFDNYIFMIFFAGAFMLFATELVAQLRWFDINRFNLTAGVGADAVPLSDSRKLIGTLFMCLALLFSQTQV